ncbi:hypothetical protein CH368_16895 [Leptospira levettii]|nr:hypothetical protein CH368_16895 [Leptospira levettii]
MEDDSLVRLIDLGTQINKEPSFTWYLGEFHCFLLANHNMIWNTWEDFEFDFLEDTNKDPNSQYLNLEELKELFELSNWGK